jgi:hypothetical protein
MIRASIILFVPTYDDNDTPDSTVDGEGQPMIVYDDFSFEYFDYLHGVPCTRKQEKLGGSQIPGAPPMGTQEGGRTQRSPRGWPEVAAGGAGSSQALTVESHLVVGSTSPAMAAMATLPADDARHR